MDNLTYHSLRLKTIHAQAVTEVQSQIIHWKKVKKDYENLADLLSTLPDKPFHNVMIPMGPLAIMPGKLIHTNELLVHLGDSWFADISCKQGLDIISLRLKKVNKNLEDLDKVLKNIEKKTEFTEELDNSGEEPKIEIKEEVPKTYVHPSQRKRISRVKSGAASSGASAPNSKSARAKQSCFDNEALMKRLDELEKQEEEEDQLFLSESVSEANDSKSDPSSSSISSKNVSWNKKLVEGSYADSDDSDDVIPSPAIINFHHTRNKPKISPVTENNYEDSKLLHPGHIGRKPSTSMPSSDIPAARVAGDSTSKSSSSSNEKTDQPKSILKRGAVDQSSTETAIAKPIQAAVSDVVLERSSEVNKVEEKTVTKKRISKFKASRQR